jgi:citrate lyase subunit beta/citryl-CoA lyase
VSSKPIPSWRSILFVPVTVDRFVDKAHERGADALLLDLEDSVAASEKELARTMLDTAIRKASRGPADIGVRINRPLDLMVRDLEAAVQPGVSFIAVPKVEGALHVQLIAGFISELEIKRGLPEEAIQLLVNVESASAFGRMEEIAKAHPRVAALTLGSEDFCTSCHMEVSAEGLFMPKQMSVLAACAAGVLPVGFIGSVAGFSDIEDFRQVIRRSKALGFRCGYAIHPNQVQIMNEEFAPSPAEIEYASALLEAAATALQEKLGAVTFRGRMIDKPMFDRARRLIERAQVFAASRTTD